MNIINYNKLPLSKFHPWILKKQTEIFEYVIDITEMFIFVILQGNTLVKDIRA